MKHSISGRALVALLAVVLVIGCVAGGTVAYLVSKPQAITNTFTVGDINATLTETTTTYHIVPGVDIKKDPVATIKAGSEDCYLFVKVDEANWPTFTEADGKTRKVNYTIADGWTLLDGQTNVYCRTVTKSESEQKFNILKDNVVTVSDTLTKDELNRVTTQPTLTFTVYAVQKTQVKDAATAWGLVNTQN